MIPRNHKVVMIPSFTVEDRHEWWSSLPVYCRSQLSYKSRSRITDRLHLGEAEIVSQQREHESSHSSWETADVSWHLPFHNALLWLDGLEAADRLVVLRTSEAKVAGIFPHTH